MRVRRSPSVRALMVLAVAAAGLAPGTASATPALRRMFVTSASGTGDLSSWGSVSGNQDGIAGANQVCQSLAEAAGLAAAGEQFRAWISTATTDAWCNVQGLTGKRVTNPACDGGAPAPLGPWVRTDGVLLAEGLAQIAGTSPVLHVPAELDENGDFISTHLSLLTGTLDGGSASSANCSGWTTTGGQDQPGSTAAVLSWGRSSSLLACSTPQRIACFELGEGLPVRRPSAPGHLIFLTEASGNGDLSSWPGAGGETGLAAGDAVCRAEAAAAGLPLPLSFHAWLSDSAHDAACHGRGLPGLLSTSCDGAPPPPDAPYRRVDGFVAAESFVDLLDGRLGAASFLTAAGLAAGGISAVTGTLATGTLSGQGSCSDWTDSSGSGTMQYGFAYSILEAWTQAGGKICSAADSRLQCLSTAVVAFWDGFEGGSLDRWSGRFP